LRREIEPTWGAPLPIAQGRYLGARADLPERHHPEHQREADEGAEGAGEVRAREPLVRLPEGEPDLQTDDAGLPAREGGPGRRAGRHDGLPLRVRPDTRTGDPRAVRG